ncbi:hypothetical protein E5F84_23530 [Shigella flexneri]|nr:hypothetical protein E5F84_23530 [Shigella flexneri]
MGSCAAPSAKGDDKFITTDYLQQCPRKYTASMSLSVLQVPQQAGGPLVSSISVFAKPDE